MEMRRHSGNATRKNFSAFGYEFFQEIGVLVIDRFDRDVDPHQQLVTYEAKWSPNSEADLRTPPRCPADVTPELAAEISRVALAAFRVVGCRDYARIDLRVNAEGRVFILEVNGNPDLSPSAGLARSLRAAGIDYDEFINRMTEQAAALRSGTSVDEATMQSECSLASRIARRNAWPATSSAITRRCQASARRRNPSLPPAASNTVCMPP